MKRKRILYCEANVDGTVGGSFFSLLFLIEGLDRAEFEPIAVFHREHALLPRYREAGIDTRVIPVPAPVVFRSALLKPVQRAVNLYRHVIGHSRQLARLLRDEQVDLVHLNNSIKRNHAWMMAARWTGIPCITHERGINPRFTAMDRWLGRGLARVICISAAVRRNLEARGLGDLPLTTIYNGIDPDVLRVDQDAGEIRRRHGVGADQRVIVMLGNIKEWKGQATLVQAMARIRRSIPEAVCLLVGDVADSDHYYYERVTGLIEDLDLGGHVILTGYQSNVADYINASECVVHASTEPEPFGRVIIEAMALERPVVGADAGAVPEIIVDTETGRLFPPGDAEALAEAVCDVLNRDKDHARDMGRRGRERLERVFHIHHNIQATLACYREVLG